MEERETIDLLLTYDVRKHRNEHDNVTHYLHVACMRNKLCVVEKLLSYDQGVELVHSINRAVTTHSMFWASFTPLHFAVYYGCIETVEYLLKYRANIMIQDSKQLTPLHWADLQRNEKIVDLLLSAHKYEFGDPTSRSCLSHFHIACTRNYPSIVEHFLKLRSNIDRETQSEPW
ncbi:hypothetical protein QAD02_018932 [Eretmocerus hayati]|uniref:Uncharacterized protein n=1 Tax=Eretmocerus hayati TaxID=131215 RepID=A0ACC2PHS0_9HYME|nr:hypothetical protein QAD02_018932 [Eretmocerus hayati]